MLKVFANGDKRVLIAWNYFLICWVCEFKSVTVHVFHTISVPVLVLSMSAYLG